MKRISREALSYALLLLVLFMIASIASYQTIRYLHEQVAAEQHNVVTALISSLTLGFMLIAGAFGLWAIQFSTAAERKRSLSRIVDSMDYLSDGLLAVDRKGNIKAANKMAADIARYEFGDKQSLRDAFPCLSLEDASLLLRQGHPDEVERRLVRSNTSRSLRFRSQPSEGLILILVSDITSAAARNERNRQIARLQLIGQLARGVAHDFNDLLCAVSGHASLLPRLKPNSPEMHESLSAIARNTERGVVLARHLLKLSRSSPSTTSLLLTGEHLKSAAQIIRDSLPESWSTEISVSALPPVALGGLQLEQIVANLGVILSDSRREPGTVRISAGPPGPTPLFDVGDEFAGVVVIETSGHGSNAPLTSNATANISGDIGIMQSVIASMLGESGGGLDCLSAADGSPLYRIRLPHGTATEGHQPPDPELALDLGTYIRGWTILLAAPSSFSSSPADRLGQTGAKLKKVDSIPSALASLDETGKTDAIVIHSQLLGHESKGILNALQRLKPLTGVTVLNEDSSTPPPQCVGGDVVFISSDSSFEKLLTAIIEARSLASRRGL